MTDLVSRNYQKRIGNKDGKEEIQIKRVEDDHFLTLKIGEEPNKGIDKKENFERRENSKMKKQIVWVDKMISHKHRKGIKLNFWVIFIFPNPVDSSFVMNQVYYIFLGVKDSSIDFLLYIKVDVEVVVVEKLGIV